MLISGQDQFTAQICLEGTDRSFIELHTIYNDLHIMYIVILCQVPAFLTIIARINGDIGEIQRVAAEAALAWVGNVLFSRRQPRDEWCGSTGVSLLWRC